MVRVDQINDLIAKQWCEPCPLVPKVVYFSIRKGSIRTFSEGRRYIASLGSLKHTAFLFRALCFFTPTGGRLGGRLDDKWRRPFSICTKFWLEVKFFYAENPNWGYLVVFEHHDLAAVDDNPLAEERTVQR